MVEGVCLFDEGGWKLSSTANNSWLSKIYLNQYVVESVLGIKLSPLQKEISDKVHVQWLQDPGNRYYAWSDQMVKGFALGSKYYPRGVTSILWY